MKKVLVLVAAAVVLSACGSTTTIYRDTTATSALVTTEAAPIPSESSSPALDVDLLVQVIWSGQPKADRKNMCTVYLVSPDLAESSFKKGFGKNGTLDPDDAWNSLVTILDKEC